MIANGITNIHSSTEHDSSVPLKRTPGSSANLAVAMLQMCTERISIVNSNLQFLGASPAALTALGLTEQELVQTSVQQTIGKACFQKNLKKTFKLALQGISGKAEFTYQDNNPINAGRHFEYHLAPFYCAPGFIEGVIIREVDLTEEHQVDIELASAKQRLKDFADATSDWYWEMDEQLRFTWLSSAYYDFYKVDRSELYGKHRTPILETEQEFAEWEEHCHLLKTLQPFRDYEYRMKTRSGIGWSRTSGVPVFDKGRFCGYRGTAKDVTQIKEIESKALRAESRFIHAIDEFPGAFALFDENECLVVHNRRYQQLHEVLGGELKPGLNYERCLRLQIEKKLISKKLENEDEWVEKRLENFRKPTGPIEVKKADNKWYRISEQRLPDGGCLKTMLDITEQKNAEMVVKEERNLLRSLIDGIPHMIYAKNNALEFTVLNKAAAEFLGRSTDLGASQTQQNNGELSVISQHEILGIQAIDKQVIDEEKEIKNLERQDTRASDGKKIWVSTCKSPLYDINGDLVGLVGATSDITASKDTEAELIRSKARFRDFAETAADWFWEMDANRNISYLSERYTEITGTDAAGLIGKNHRVAADMLLVDESSKQRFVQCIERSVAFSNLEATILTDLNEAHHFYISGKPWFDEKNNFCGFRGVGRDVTNFRQLESQLSYQASHDELTGLTNRREFMQRLENLVRTSKHEKTGAVLGYLDLDQFKVINDTAGHHAGDQLLVQVAQLLEGCIRKTDTLSRLGGDEFGILLNNTTPAEAEDTMQRIVTRLEEVRFPWDENVFSIGTSIGLVAIDDNDEGSTELLSKADLACYSAKDAGRGKIRFYNAQNDDIIDRRSQLLAAASITEAIENDRFILYAQPIVPINQQEQSSVHYEILLRMLDDEDQLIFPGAFIPAAERYDLMARIDRWVIAKSLQQLNDVFQPQCACGITINLSGQSLSDTSLADYVKKQLQINNITPSRICFEITETAAISNFKYAQNFINTLKDIGCTFALDDFGSGLSSFGYLKHFKVDYLKIDGSFVRDIVSDPTDRVMVTSINQVGQLLGMRTIAEFVENAEILDVLTEIEVDYVQGYAVGKPQEFQRSIMFPGTRCT